MEHEAERQQLIRIGQDFWQRGWSRGTSSNYSVVVGDEPTMLLITASGKDKGELIEQDFVLMDLEGQPTAADQPKSSAETLLHCWAVAKRNAGAVLHAHSVWATVLSTKHASQKAIWFEGYEMLKGLAGITTHETRVCLPIFANQQDMSALRIEVDNFFKDAKPNIAPGFLLAGHGIYAWGEDLATAKRHIEVLEFLLECTARSMMLR